MDTIGSFAENLINEELNNIQEGNSSPSMSSDSLKLTPAGKDIKNVDVPDYFRQQVLRESYNYSNSTKNPTSFPELVWTDPESESESEEENSTPQILTESTAQELIPLLREIKAMLQEMTTAGMLGTNMAGPQRVDRSFQNIETKHGYKKAKKSSLRSKKPTRKQVLKKSIQRRIRKK